MKYKNCFSIAVIASVFSLSAYGATFPEKIEGLNSKTAEEMKAWPDVKVKLGAPLTADSLKGKSETELTLMRNSIPAQAGMKFTEPWLKNYFASRPWYKGAEFDYKKLGKVDYANAQMIKKYQKEHGLYVSTAKMARDVAGRDTPSLLTGEELRKRILTMRYCDFYGEGDYFYTITFHKDKTVTVSELSEEGAYGNSYGAAYGYGSAYGKGKGMKGIWGLEKDGKHIFVRLQEDPMTLYFGTRSYYQHRCYDDAQSVP